MRLAVEIAHPPYPDSVPLPAPGDCWPAIRSGREEAWIELPFVGRGRGGREKLGRENSGSRNAQRGLTAGVAGLAPWKSRGPVLPPYFLLPLLNFLSTVAHCPPPEPLNPLLVPPSPQPVSGKPAPVPTGRCRPPSGTRTARAGHKSRFHDSLPSSNAPNLSPPTPSPGPSLGARGAARAVPAVTAAARAPAGRERAAARGVGPGRAGWGGGRRAAPRVEVWGEETGGGGGGRDLGAGKRVAGGEGGGAAHSQG